MCPAQQPVALKAAGLAIQLFCLVREGKLKHASRLGPYEGPRYCWLHACLQEAYKLAVCVSVLLPLIACWAHQFAQSAGLLFATHQLVAPRNAPWQAQKNKPQYFTKATMRPCPQAACLYSIKFHQFKQHDYR